MRLGLSFSLLAHGFVFLMMSVVWKSKQIFLDSPSIIQVKFVPIEHKTEGTELQKKKPVQKKPNSEVKTNKTPSGPQAKKPEKKQTEKKKPVEKQPTSKPDQKKLPVKKASPPDNPLQNKRPDEKKKIPEKPQTKKPEKSEEADKKELKSDFFSTLTELENVIKDEKTDEKLSAEQASKDEKISLSDLVKSKIQACWRMPLGVPDIEELSVTVQINLKQDGSLMNKPKIINYNEIYKNQNPYHIRASEEALRAIEKCAPYRELPRARYDEWSKITIQFAPGEY